MLTCVWFKDVQGDFVLNSSLEEQTQKRTNTKNKHKNEQTQQNSIENNDIYFNNQCYDKDTMCIK